MLLTFAYAIEPLPARGAPFAITLALGSVIAWSILRPAAHPFPDGLKLKRTLLTPSIAAVVTLVVMALLREYYSGAIVVVFGVSFTAWLALGRLGAHYLAPTPRILCVGDTPWSKILSDTQLATVEIHTTPPSRDRDWSSVLIDGRQELDRGWLVWLADADLRSIPILDGRTLTEQLTGQIDTDSLDGRWANEIFRGNTRYLPWKRGFDLIASVTLLPLLLPLLMLVAVLVRRSSPGRILLKQERIGLHGRPFQMIKFRTMRDHQPEEAAFTQTHDHRITPVGHWLRKHRLDEIPQFLNVLRGDMSIIGPRPEQATFVADFQASIPLYTLRHHVRPGISGWAQVHSGYAASEEDTRTKLRYDLWYLKYFSLTTDLVIILKTARVILSGRGAR